MAEPRENRSRAILSIRDLHVYYGQSHCLQGINLELDSGILAVVGRNGMGKTTLCNAIAGLTKIHSGSLRFRGRELNGRLPDEICHLGIGYVPQGRRVWPSLTVHEHLQLAYRGGDDASWSIERIYQTFPSLADRRNNGGGQLSGGEQQMLAIARALLVNPSLLVMDEPTEGLAPLIVRQVERMLLELAQEDSLSVLLIEQNMGVATQVSENVAVLVNGVINRIMPADRLAADVPLQQKLLGVGRHDDPPEQPEAPTADSGVSRSDTGVRYFSLPAAESADSRPTPAIPNRWGVNLESARLNEQISVRPAEIPQANPGAEIRPLLRSSESRWNADEAKTLLVVGTFDTKGEELFFIRDEIAELGVAVRTVDVSTSTTTSRCDVSPKEIASYRPAGGLNRDRGESITAMRNALVNWIARQRDVAGIISAGGSGGTALVTPAMRELPVGIPKLMISTVASGDVREYVGASDIMMLHSVADVQGINSISRQILRNGAHAVAGAVKALPDKQQRQQESLHSLPSIGLTMFGVTTPCVQNLTAQLQQDFDCLVFHCTGTGGGSMEALVRSNALAAVIDVTTTEVADHLVGGVFSAGPSRLDAFSGESIPYVGSCGALDMVNFGAVESVPAVFKDRLLQVHNPQVTLMRTTPDENRQFGTWIGNKLNQMQGPVRFLLPRGGVSLLDQPGQPFHDPQADTALFDALQDTVVQNAQRKLISVDANINEASFVGRLLESFHAIYRPIKKKRA